MNYAAAVLGRLLFTFLAIQQFSESAPLKVKRNTCEHWGASESIIENYRILENLTTINVNNCYSNSSFNWDNPTLEGDLKGFDQNDIDNIELVRRNLAITLPVMKNMSLVELLNFEDCCEQCLQAKTNIVNLLHLVSFMVSGLYVHVCT